MGTAQKGPAFQPVRVESWAEFLKVFGQPGAGGAGDDPSRYGVESMCVDYAAWAAKAYLQNNSPLTFVRILGSEHPNASPGSGQAGWNIAAGGTPNHADNHAGAAHGLFVTTTQGSETITLKCKATTAATVAHVVELTLPAMSVANNAAVISVVLRGPTIVNAAGQAEDLVVTSAAAGAPGGKDQVATKLAAALDTALNNNFGFPADSAAVAGSVVTITGPATGDQFEVVVIDEPAEMANVTPNITATGVAAQTFAADAKIIRVGATGVAANILDLANSPAGVLDGLTNAVLNGNSAATVAGLLAPRIQNLPLVNSAVATGEDILITPSSGAARIVNIIKQHFVVPTGGLKDSSGQAAQSVGEISTDHNADNPPATGDGDHLTVTLSPTGAIAEGRLAAIVHAKTSTKIRLVGEKLSDASTVTSADAQLGDVIKSAAGGLFSLAIIGESNGTKVKEFSLDHAAEKHIRNKLNTNPVLLNDGLTSAGQREDYFLAESFDGELKATYDTGLSGEMYGVMLPLADGSNYSAGHQRAETPWVQSQHSGEMTKWRFSELTNLFKFVALDNGEAGNRYKISIGNITVPRGNQRDVRPYGTFSVIIRHASDSDAGGKMRIVQQFNGCDLDPRSTNYIARKIGDQYFYWNPTERRLETRGTFPNKSSLFRVEVATDLAKGGLSPDLMPAAFEGPPRMGRIYTLNGAVARLASGADGEPNPADAAHTSPWAGGLGTPIVEGGAGWVKVPFLGPSIRMRLDSTEHGNNQDTAFFGADTCRAGTNDPDPSYLDLVSYRALAMTAARSEPSFKFSLELLRDGHLKANTAYDQEKVGDVVIDAGTRCFFMDLTATDHYLTDTHDLTSAAKSTIAGASATGFADVCDRVAGFTLPCFGGFNGQDIREMDPMNERLLALSSIGRDNAAYFAVEKAIDIIADPEFVEYNMLSAPGVVASSLTDKILLIAEQRGDALAVIDLENIYRPSTSKIDAERDPISTLVSRVKERSLNSSYGCAYAPWLLVDARGAPVWMPPSVAGIGTMGSSESVSELWFAPAGFNRGGLSEGSAGIGVMQVSHHLTSKQRDDLYDVSVNPIASFPSEGIVVFGQKTLQSFQSALDRINVRRLLIHVKKRVSQISSRLLFEQNIEATWLKFKLPVEKFLSGIRSGGGLTDFRVVLDETTTTPDLIDRNIMYAKVLLKPARAIEYIAVDFVITNTGASFDD